MMIKCWWIFHMVKIMSSQQQAKRIYAMSQLCGKALGALGVHMIGIHKIIRAATDSHIRQIDNGYAIPP